MIVQYYRSPVALTPRASGLANAVQKILERS
jgi:hypothetical protein